MKKSIIFALVLVLFFASCATKTKIEYRDRDVNHYITNTVHDTVISNTHDSIYYEIVTKGDTVFATKYKEKFIYLDKIKIEKDTCWRDSVVTQYKETIKEVVKIPKIYKIALFVSLLSIIFAIVKLSKWLRIS